MISHTIVVPYINMLRILIKERRTIVASPVFGKKFQVEGAFVYDFVA
jgi:hypothetical protein